MPRVDRSASAILRYALTRRGQRYRTFPSGPGSSSPERRCLAPPLRIASATLLVQRNVPISMDSRGTPEKARPMSFAREA